MKFLYFCNSNNGQFDYLSLSSLSSLPPGGFALLAAGGTALLAPAIPAAGVGLAPILTGMAAAGALGLLGRSLIIV